MRRARINSSHWYVVLAVGGIAACSSDGGSPVAANSPSTSADRTNDGPNAPSPPSETSPDTVEGPAGAPDTSAGSSETAPPISGISEGTSETPAGAGAPVVGPDEPSGSEEPAPVEPVDNRPPAAPEGVIPNREYPPEMVNVPTNDWQRGLVSPTLESEHHNQPSVINGYLALTGDARFSFYDISDPSAPRQLSVRVSPNDCQTCGAAEGHQVSYAKYGDRIYSVTIQGRGIDIWDVTDVRDPQHLTSVNIEGIDYGDFTEAAWGVNWQGSTIYVGGTNTGLHVIDATDPANASVVGRLPNVGGVSAGPVFAVGNVLVVTTPKQAAGIATVDISNPRTPLILDSATSGEESYIGAFYGHHAYLLNPIRVFDVLTDPTDIRLVSSGSVGGYFEYLSFQDGFAFAGRIRPNPGATKIDVTNPEQLAVKSSILGRRNLAENDDQFTVAIGNLLVMSDDQLSPATNRYAGTVIAVHDTAPDTTPPAVDFISPRDGATGQAVTSRVGISFTDNVELATVDSRSFIVRTVGGRALEGTWGVSMSVLNFEPEDDFEPGTTYEVVLPAGGIKDYVGNGIAQEFRTTFTTR
jgi:hypothetical protein